MKLLRFLSTWPLWLLHSVGWLLGWWVFVFSSTYRRRFLENTKQAGIARWHWLQAVGQAGCQVAELPRLWLGRPVPIRIQGREHFETALARGRGLVLLTPHLGCFEVTAQAYALQCGSKQPITVMFKPAKQAWLNAALETVRNRPAMTAVPAQLSGIRHMLKALRQRQTIGLLPDQVPPQGQGEWAPFFGRSAYTMTLSARLVTQADAALLLMWGERLSWGRGYVVHVCTFEQTLSDDSQRAAAQINQAMENLILQCPQQYLWGYARYKEPKQEAS